MISLNLSDEYYLVLHLNNVLPGLEILEKKALAVFLGSRGLSGEDLARVLKENEARIEAWWNEDLSQFRTAVSKASGADGGSKVDVGFDELKKAFYRHKQLARGDTTSHYLLLFYAVECGLKALYLQNSKQHNEKVSTVLAYKEKVLATHNLELLINFLPGISSDISSGCPSCRTKRNSSEVLSIEKVHQAWRYGVQLQRAHEKKVVAWLWEVAVFIENNMF